MTPVTRKQPYLSISGISPNLVDLARLLRIQQEESTCVNVGEVIPAINEAVITMKGYNNPLNDALPHVDFYLRVQGLFEVRNSIKIASLGNLPEHLGKKWVQVESSLLINSEEGSGLAFCSSDSVFGNGVLNPFIKENGWLFVSPEQEKEFKTAISDLNSKIQEKYLKEISNIINGVLTILEEIRAS